tara:strand:+ start:226 stop:348 length:123 start_codon:yes stop_codon:yes gene_type:complete
MPKTLLQQLADLKQKPVVECDIAPPKKKASKKKEPKLKLL